VRVRVIVDESSVVAATTAEEQRPQPSTRRNPVGQTKEAHEIAAQDKVVAATTAVVTAATALSSAVQFVSSKTNQVPSSNEESVNQKLLPVASTSAVLREQKDSEDCKLAPLASWPAREKSRQKSGVAGKFSGKAL